MCFTSYPDDEPKYDASLMQFMVFQREKCPTTGTLHYQGYVEFHREQGLRTIQGALGVGACRLGKRKGSQLDNIKYCTKEESRVQPPIKFGTPKTEGAGNGGITEGGADVYRRALHCTNAESALRVIREGLPRDYFKSFNSIKAAVDHRYGKKRKEYSKTLEFAWKLPEEIKNWIATEFVKMERAKCLVVVGPTRLGKTAWARSLGKHMFWRTTVAYGDWNDEAKYIVMDDIDWQYIPQKKGILTQMGEVTLTDKYVKKITVDNNKPAIVLTNKTPDFGDEQAYWHANTTIVQITESLIDKTQKALKI